MRRKWLVYDLDLDEVFLRPFSLRAFEYQYVKSLAVQAHKKYGGNYEVRLDKIYY